MLAIIGYGDHVQRNIMPVLNNIQNIEVKYVVVRDKDKYKYNKKFVLLSDFSKVLADKEINHVYVATPISEHYRYVKLALSAGKNVLCEKALTTSYEKSKDLVDLAKLKKLKLQEVVMYQYHDQFEWIKNYLNKKQNNKLIKIHSTFQIPHLSADNIRYSKKLGGGALLDVGFYPLSMIISLLGMPNKISSTIFGQTKSTVDLSGISIFNYTDLYAVAEWGIGRIYKNELILEFEDHQVVIERAFSKPSHLETVAIIINKDGENKKILISSCDHFKLLILDFLKSNNINNEKHLMSILERADLIDQIKVND